MVKQISSCIRIRPKYPDPDLRFYKNRVRIRIRPKCPDPDKQPPQGNLNRYTSALKAKFNKAMIYLIAPIKW